MKSIVSAILVDVDSGPAIWTRREIDGRSFSKNLVTAGTILPLPLTKDPCFYPFQNLTRSSPNEDLHEDRTS